MKKKHISLLLYFFILSLNSCRNPLQEAEPAYCIKGVLMDSCGGVVLANKYLELIQPGNIGTPPGQVLHTYTDSLGEFIFNYRNSSGSSLYLDYGSPSASANYRLMMGIPHQKNIDLGNTYVYNKVTIIIKLSTVNTFTPADTLYYAVGEVVGYFQLPGPLSNGIIDTILTKRGYTTGGDDSYAVPFEQTALYWGIGWEDFYYSAITWNTPEPYHKIPFTTRGNCMVDTAYLNIP